MPISDIATLPLCRLGEPSFCEKLNCRFDVPAEHLAPRYQPIGAEILGELDNENVRKIPVQPIDYPNLDHLKELERLSTFCMFNKKHLEYARELIDIFQSAKNMDELISLALYVRDQVNIQLFVYAYSVVLTHRYKKDNIELPQLFEICPNKFFKKSILLNVREASQSQKRVGRQTNGGQQLTVVPFRSTMSVLNPEEKMTFFREDIGVNSHHWHWHLVFPPFPINPKPVDRHGELFYYMHHILMNYYDCTRLAQRIPVVVGFHNFRDQIDVGYFSNLTTATSSYNIPPRQDKSHLHDLNRDSNSVELSVGDLERWYERLQEAIDNGFFVDTDGSVVNMLNDTGIDNLVNLMEANYLSKNIQYYGNLHNSGHEMISLIHDPKMKYKEQGGVMGDTTTAARDPVFYRWHKMIDDLCSKLKDRLPPYQRQQLAFKGIAIKSFDVLDELKNKSTEELITFWQQSTVNLQSGLDFHVNSPILVSFTHLNYRQFGYSLKVENKNTSPVVGTLRIFLLPLNDDKEQKFLYEGSRKLAIELDRFLVNLVPGMNNIYRKSSDSSLTIPFNRTFPLQRDGKLLLSDQNRDVQTVCMCGWPQHMLLPKGSDVGHPYRLFAMISDYKVDKIDQKAPNGICNDNYILCGLRNRKYPDSRPMGYPFDRPAGPRVMDFEDFTDGLDNMSSKLITIRHLDENKVYSDNNANDVTKNSQ